MSSIFNLTQEMLSLINQVEEAEGELTPELEEALAITEEALEAKVVNYGWATKFLQADTDIISAEIKRLQEKKKAKEKTIERLKETAAQAMMLFGKTKIDTPTLTVSLRKSESVVVENESLLPLEYLVEKVTVSADKAAIKQALKSGIELEGASIQEKQNLQLK